MVESRPMRKLLSRYAQTLFVQTACTALANATHRVDERLARSLLMVHDRTAGDRLSVTHDFLAGLLNVRRPSVTTALHILEGHRSLCPRGGRWPYATVRLWRHSPAMLMGFPNASSLVSSDQCARHDHHPGPATNQQGRSIL